MLTTARLLRSAYTPIAVRSKAFAFVCGSCATRRHEAPFAFRLRGTSSKSAQNAEAGERSRCLRRSGGHACNEERTSRPYGGGPAATGSPDEHCVRDARPSDDSHRHAEGKTATNKAKTELKTERAPRCISQDVLFLAGSDGVSLGWVCAWTGLHSNEHYHLWKFSSRYLLYSRPFSFCFIIKKEIDTLRMGRHAWTYVPERERG